MIQYPINCSRISKQQISILLNYDLKVKQWNKLTSNIYEE